MLKKFPLFYISLIYTFSAKDKIVFFMNQFSLFCSVLTIGLIISIFSIMNGFEENLVGNVINHYGHLYIKNNSKGINALESANSFNNGFDMLSLNNSNIDKLEYIKMQQTMIVINDNQHRVFVMQEPTLTEPIVIPENLDKNIDKINPVSIFDPESYNPLTQTFRHKVYTKYTTMKSKIKDPIVFMSTDEYKKLFRNDNYTFVKIYLKNESLINDTFKDLKAQIDPSLEIHSWREFNPQFVSALDLQKKIFFLVYSVLFILLTAIIISINIAFFKEKRKDWALLKILNISAFSVEKVFLYKNIISIFLTCFLGTILGYLLTLYSNEILTSLLYFSDGIYQSKFFFGQEKIPHTFLLKDFLIVNVFSSTIFFLNFFILFMIFKKESVSQLYKLG